jgi:uncharacterized protein (UPF0212 family)
MKYTVLLEKITEEDADHIVVDAESVSDAIRIAKEETGQSVIEVEEDFLA